MRFTKRRIMIYWRNGVFIPVIPGSVIILCFFIALRMEKLK